ncbi:MAG: DUF4369 domain-containing protein [Bacteroidaceae bacterium]|nr:DUF4369 domain-containing protein [Bacteroidaceae bacterium]
MKKHSQYIYIGVAALAGLLLTACAETYKVLGATNVHEMEGKMLYLKVYDNDELRNMDSCRVTHGKFEFRGVADSVVMANLFVGEQSVLPVVLEGSNISLTIEEQVQSVSGSPLNDTLYSFIRHKLRLDEQLAALPSKEGRMVMDGMDHFEVVRILNREADSLAVESDRLTTSFIKRNINNVLGPGVFMIMTSTYPYPVLTPLIEELFTIGTPYFLNHPYVKAYREAATENMEKMHEQ